MNFEVNKLYDAIFLGDLHYLLHDREEARAENDIVHLIDYFHKNNIRFRKIILVGDVIESWAISARKAVKKKPENLLRLFIHFDRICCPNTHKIYILGNHDSYRFDLKLPAVIEEPLREMQWKLTEIYQTSDYIALHGHQGQYGRLRWYAGVLGLRISSLIASFLPTIYSRIEQIFWHYYNFSRHPTATSSLRFYLRVQNLVEQNGRLIIAAHTHRPVIMPHLKILNTGDWVNSRSLIVKNADSFHLLEFRGDHFIELNPSIKNDLTVAAKKG